MLKSVNIANSVTKIARCAFDGCTGLPSIVLPNNLTIIGSSAFWECISLTSIVLPNNLTIIANAAFYECFSLTSITFPNGIIEFGNGVFDRCTKLTSITNLNPVPYSINPLAFGYLNLNIITLYVPKNSVSAYKKADVWKEFNIVGIDVGIDEYEGETDGEPLLIYPNPATGTCSIVIPEEFQNESNLFLSIYDNSGKMVQQFTIDNENPEYSLKIDSKSAGVYVAVLSNGKRSVRGKIVFN